MHRWFVALPFIALAGSAACTPPAPPAHPLQVPPPPGLKMTLGAEDIVTIRVYGEPDLSGDFEVATDGAFQYPLLGTVKAGGLTPGELAFEIQGGLAHGFLKDPQVTVIIKDYNSRRVVVYGEVQHPGQFPFLDGMSIAQAISDAGGFTQMAAKDAVIVKRVSRNEQQSVRVDVESIAEGQSSDYYLVPGDQVFVPQRIF